MSEINMTVIAYASGFMVAAHAGQKRKFTGEDYAVHPKRVCEILDEHGHSDMDTLVAALLHDVVEDTHVTLPQIIEYFGKDVGELVMWLTKLEHPTPLPRATRKALDADRLRMAPVTAKTIKLADRLDNMTILTEDPKFAPVFAAETRTLLDEALRGGCPVLWAKVDAIVREFQERPVPVRPYPEGPWFGTK